MTFKSIRNTAYLVFLFCCHGVEANDAPPAYSHLKPIESFVGVWKARFDPPGDVPEGDLEIHFQWMGNKSYLQSIVYFHPDGAPADVQLNPEFTIIGYDAEDAATKAWHFKYTNQGQTDATIQTNQLVVQQQEGQPGDANYRQQTKTYKLEDATTLVITETGSSADAEATNPPPLRLSKAADNKNSSKLWFVTNQN
jgi:hypothetical protein